MFIRYTLRKMLPELIKSLNKYNVHYWIDFGTLLGIIREDDIIWLDNDIDICVVETDELHYKMKLVKEDLAKKGFDDFRKMDWSAYRLYKNKFIHSDIYINNIDYNKGVFIGATGENSNIPIEYISSCKWIYSKKFDIPIKVPVKIHETLVWRYGQDYMTPKKKFKGRDS
jgi:phosphorylcholine metabolism protein LicD